MWKEEPTAITAPNGGDLGLPEELAGLELDPDKLEDIQGDDETAVERIIIVYPKEREQELARLVGLEKIKKVVYHIDEIWL